MNRSHLVLMLYMYESENLHVFAKFLKLLEWVKVRVCLHHEYILQKTIQGSHKVLSMKNIPVASGDNYCSSM